MKAIASAVLVCLTVNSALAQPATAPGAAQAAPAAAIAVPSLSARMDRLARFYADNNQFMGAILVARGERILVNKAYGFANIEWKIANTPGTKFRLGSVTKQFTAAAILILEERGKLSIDDPVKAHMPDAPAAWDKITLRHLLNHTSGIANFTGFPDFGRTRSIAQTPQELVARFKDRPLEFEPGSRWNYTNSGYVLLGYLIERISGVSYEKFATDNIFTPLGMKDSGCDSNTALIARRAAGYTPRGGRIQNADFVHMSVTLGGGMLYSTTGDLLRWERGLFGGKLLRPETLAKMTTPVLDDYGMGVFVRNVSGRKQVAHPGGIDGFNAYTVEVPDDGLTVIVLANLNGPATEVLATKLAAMALNDNSVVIPSERRRVALDTKTLARHAGRYQVNPNAVAEVTTEKGRVFLKMGNGPANEIFPVGQNRFFRAIPDGDLEFSGPDGAPAAELLLPPESGAGAPTRARRIGAE